MAQKNKIPKWMSDGKKEPTRFKSDRAESKIASMLKGKKFINSGATLGQNDVFTDYAEVESKVTSKSSFTLKQSDWKLLMKKCSIDKIPIFTVEFEENDLVLAVLDINDLTMLINKVNS